MDRASEERGHAALVTVMGAADLPAERPVIVRVNERDLALVRCAEGGDPHVVDNRCPHRGGQLGDGSVRGDDIVCPLHGYDFDLHTGLSRFDPAERVAVHPVRLHRDEIQVAAEAVPPRPVGHDRAYQARWARTREPREPSTATSRRWGGAASRPSARCA